MATRSFKEMVKAFKGVRGPFQFFGVLISYKKYKELASFFAFMFVVIIVVLVLILFGYNKKEGIHKNPVDIEAKFKKELK